MIGAIDVHDLPEKYIKVIHELVELLREKVKMEKGESGKKEEEKIDFASWPLGVKGKLTRREIYDHL